MSKRKTEFQLVWSSGHHVPNVKAHIIGQIPETGRPYVSIDAFAEPIFIADKDLERFAVNILKALNSKKLK